MAWFFLPEVISTAADVLPVLMRNRIPAMPHSTQRPTIAQGVAFEVRDDQKVDDILEFLGLGHIDFRARHTDQDGILFLERTQVKKRAAEKPPEKPEAGSAAFARNVLTQERALRAKQEEALDALKAEVAEAERAFFATARQFHDAVEQHALGMAVEAKDDERLAAEHDAILKDPRVTSLVTTATLCIVDTHPMILESEPRRFLGRYRVTVGLTDGSFLVTAQDGIAEYPHPSVSKRGVPYLGPLRDALIRRLGGHEYATVIRMLLDFLQEPPTTTVLDAMAPERWPEVGEDGKPKGAPPMRARSSVPATPVDL